MREESYKEQPVLPDPMEADNAHKLDEFFGSCESDRSTVETQWKKLAYYLEEADFRERFGDAALTLPPDKYGMLFYTEVKKRTAYLYESFSPNSEWFSLVPSATGGEDQRELDDIKSQVLERFADNGLSFYDTVYHAVFDASKYGTGVVQRVENPSDKRKQWYRYLPLEQCYLYSDIDGEINALMFRQYVTKRQLTLKYSKVNETYDTVENATEEVVTFYLTEEETKKLMLDTGKQKKPWYTCTIRRQGKEMLTPIKGFDRKPFFVTRMNRDRQYPYGTSDTWAALASVNHIRELEALQLNNYNQANTVYLGSASQHVPKIKLARFLPGTLDSEGRELLKPITLGIPQLDVIPHLQILKNELRMLLSTENLYREQGTTPPTASEITANRANFAREISPKVISLMASFLVDIVKTEVHSVTNGKLDLKDSSVILSSPYLNQQKLQSFVAASQAIQLLAPLLQGQPGAVNNFNADSILRGTAMVLGLNANHLLTERELEERNQRQQQQQQQEALLQQGLINPEEPTAPQSPL